LEKLDVYSAGIILFTLMNGCLPYAQDNKIQGLNFENLLNDQREMFWTVHSKFNEKVADLSDSFKNLFEYMTCKNPNLRLNVSQIKKHEWFNGDIYDQDELEIVMKTIIKS